MSVDPNLFDDVRDGGDGGDFWPATEGVKRLRLTGFEKGPVFKNDRTVKDPVTGVEETVQVDAPQVRWVFDVYKLTGERVMYVPESGPNSGKALEATADLLTSTVITPKSKAGKFFSVLLGRDIDYTSETKADLMAAAIGKEVLGTFGKNANGKIRLKDLTKIEE